MPIWNVVSIWLQNWLLTNTITWKKQSVLYVRQLARHWSYYDTFCDHVKACNPFTRPQSNFQCLYCVVCSHLCFFPLLLCWSISVNFSLMLSQYSLCKSAISISFSLCLSLCLTLLPLFIPPFSITRSPSPVLPSFLHPYTLSLLLPPLPPFIPPFFFPRSLFVYKLVACPLQDITIKSSFCWLLVILAIYTFTMLLFLSEWIVDVHTIEKIQHHHCHIPIPALQIVI